MDKVTKRNGVFFMESAPAKAELKEAKEKHQSDLASTQKQMNNDEIRSMLKRILQRLESLES